MEHLYAACALLTTPTHCYLERSWRVNYFERVALQNKSVLNQWDRSGNPPLARILDNIGTRRACQMDINSAVQAMRDEDRYHLRQLFIPSLMNLESLRSTVGDENLDLAAAILLVSLGASLQYALVCLGQYRQYNLESLYRELIELLVDVEQVAQREFEDRDTAAAARLEGTDQYFSQVWINQAA